MDMAKEVLARIVRGLYAAQQCPWLQSDMLKRRYCVVHHPSAWSHRQETGGHAMGHGLRCVDAYNKRPDTSILTLHDQLCKNNGKTGHSSMRCGRRHDLGSGRGWRVQFERSVLVEGRRGFNIAGVKAMSNLGEHEFADRLEFA